MEQKIFKFPKEEELNILLKDILEEKVDEKYYLSEAHVNRLINSTDIKKGFFKINPKVAGTMTARQFANWKGNFIVGNVNPSKKGINGNVYGGDIAPSLTTNKGEGPKIIQLNKPKHSNNRVYSKEGISPSLNTMQGGNRQPFIVASRGRDLKNPSDRTSGIKTTQRLEPKFDGTTNTLTSVQKDNYVCIKNATKKGYLEGYSGDGVNLEQPNSKTRRGRIQKDTIGCLQTNDQRGVITKDLNIRKLTPKECFRLMGFIEDEINLEGISNSQQYKMAGNGWDINLVSKIFKEMNLPDNLKLFEMFSGYGGASFALKKLKKPFSCVGFSEIDKFAIKCYEQNHFSKEKGLSDGKEVTFALPILNFGDCTKINENLLPNFDLLTGGFPCQSFSIAGKGLGELDTRGTLFNEIIRIAEVKQPKYMLLENVKGLTTKPHKETFNKILSELDRIGYDVFHKVCNSKKHGVPQNRERIFFVCFRKDLNYSHMETEASKN